MAEKKAPGRKFKVVAFSINPRLRDDFLKRIQLKSRSKFICEALRLRLLMDDDVVRAFLTNHYQTEYENIPEGL